MNVQLAETQWDGNSVGKLDLTTSIDGLTELRDNEEKEEGHVRLETDNTLSTSHLITVSVSTVCTGIFFALVVWVIATMFKNPRKSSDSKRTGEMKEILQKSFQNFSNKFIMALLVMCVVDSYEYISHYQFFFGQKMKWHGQTWYYAEQHYVSYINEYGRTLKTGIILALGASQVMVVTNICSGSSKCRTFIRSFIFALIAIGFPTISVCCRFHNNSSTLLNIMENFIVPLFGSVILLAAMFVSHSNGRKCKRTLGLAMSSKLENKEDSVAANKVVTLCLIILLFQSLESLLVEEVYAFNHIEYSTKYSADLIFDHINRQMYPLAYLLVVLKNEESQTILKCLNVPKEFPFLHNDQLLTDYEGCLIPSEDASSDSAHYVSKNDSLSLTNFAIMDGDESPDGGSEKSDDDIGIDSVFSDATKMKVLDSANSRYTRFE